MNPHGEFVATELQKGKRAPFAGILLDEPSFRTMVDRSEQLDICEVRFENRKCESDFTVNTLSTVEKVSWLGGGALLALLIAGFAR